MLDAKNEGEIYVIHRVASTSLDDAAKGFYSAPFCVM